MVEADRLTRAREDIVLYPGLIGALRSSHLHESGPAQNRIIYFDAQIAANQWLLDRQATANGLYRAGTLIRAASRGRSHPPHIGGGSDLLLSSNELEPVRSHLWLRNDWDRPRYK
jgi:hypothetical protein